MFHVWKLVLKNFEKEVYIETSLENAEISIEQTMAGLLRDVTRLTFIMNIQKREK